MEMDSAGDGLLAQDLRSGSIFTRVALCGQNRVTRGLDVLQLLDKIGSQSACS